MEQFITSLYSLANMSNFVELKGPMIRDYIVVGFRDEHSQECLQMEALEKTKRMV